MDEILKLPQKHLIPIQVDIGKSKRKKLTPSFFSDLNEDQLTAIFGGGLRCQLSSAYLRYGCLNRDLKLFGTLQVAPDFSPDLLSQNVVVDLFNREFDNPILINLNGCCELSHLSCTSFPVSSTSVIQITAKLYVTTDQLDDMETYIVDHVTRPTFVPAIEQKHLFDDIDDGKELRQMIRDIILQHEPLYDNEPFHNEAFHVCDDRACINISNLPDGCGIEPRFVGKDGSLHMSYLVLKYAIDAYLEVEFFSTGHKNVTGWLGAIYPDHGDTVMLFESCSSTSFITPGKVNLIRSELAVPANSYLVIEAWLHERTNSHVYILSGCCEFRVPYDRQPSIETIQGDGCSLKLKVNWKLSTEKPNIPSSSNPSVSRLTERRKFGAHSTPTMADPDERKRWSLQEEIAKVFNASLKRTFNLQEAVPCSISTCTKEDGADYLCSSVLHIWPEIKNTHLYKGPKHAGLAVKDDIMGSDKDMMERCVVCGPGFVKFKLRGEWIAKSIHTMLSVGIESWAPKHSVKKAVIYFSSHKNGFLRSSCIGEALARMLEYSGVVVLRKRYVDRVVGDPLYQMEINGLYRRLYQLLGIDVKEEDKSFYEPYTRGILDLFREKGSPIGIEGDELALVDLTVLWHALKEENADWIMDVSDVGERVRIERCITAAKSARLIASDHSKFPLSHVGFVQDNDIEVIMLLKLLDEAKILCKAFLERQDMADERTTNEHAAEALVAGAVKYTDLKNNRLTNYTIRFYDMFDGEGNTFAYLYSTHVRIRSIITSYFTDIKGLTATTLKFKYDEERELGLHLLGFTEVIEEVCTILTPHILCDYLYGLCKKFETLDSIVWPIVAHTDSEETSKLLLCKATDVVMMKSLDLLGINPIYLDC